MSTALREPADQFEIVPQSVETMADLLGRLGNISPQRVLLSPLPGTATEDDLLSLPQDLQKVCELIDGTLVVKAVGAPESEMAADLIGFLKIYLKESGQRTVRILGPDGHTRFFGGNVRMPDVAVFLRSRLPEGKLPREQVCPLPPQFTVEVLSPGNTKQEIDEKLETYFSSGVELAWVVDPRSRTVHVYTSLENVTECGLNDTLDGGNVLPGFKLSVREWLEESE